MWKAILGVMGVFVFIALMGFLFGFLDLAMFKTFEPKRENIRREIFENTQSYVQGMTQDLAKSYGEWKKADPDDKAAIETVIKTKFAAFDAEKIENETLKSFLIRVRGF